MHIYTQIDTWVVLMSATPPATPPVTLLRPPPAGDVGQLPVSEAQ